jgi:hypothetical protein
LKLYVASSWKNPFYPDVVKALQAEHEVYDFRHPEPGNDGFHWSLISPDSATWSTRQWIENIKNHPAAKKGFELDFGAMNRADACVLVLPSGRSAHLEAGWFAGQGKRLIVYAPAQEGPDLMYLMATEICTEIEDVLHHLK